MCRVNYTNIGMNGSQETHHIHLVTPSSLFSTASGLTVTFTSSFKGLSNIPFTLVGTGESIGPGEGDSGGVGGGGAP